MTVSAILRIDGYSPVGRIPTLPQVLGDNPHADESAAHECLPEFPLLVPSPTCASVPSSFLSSSKIQTGVISITTPVGMVRGSFRRTKTNAGRSRGVS